MQPDPTAEPPREDDAREDEIARVAAQLEGQLADRGADVHAGDTSDDHADLLSAVERFERARQQRGASSYTNDRSSSDPERAELVLPQRRADEGAGDYIARVRAAADAIAPQGRGEGGPHPGSAV